jgi:hypothetical protein
MAKKKRNRYNAAFIDAVVIPQEAAAWVSDLGRYIRCRPAKKGCGNFQQRPRFL